MAIEAELKAVVRDPEGVLKQLEQRFGAGRAEVYRERRSGHHGAPPVVGTVLGGGGGGVRRRA
ncbi:hypothetical protein ACIRVF_14525 [Kitasatospora sp. NPDC101157]|uniref:hypothetical protein n=1 Tax=Kitasatospora sp. NPDC101157 TaxID=3364098 RepID=UPI00380D7F90